MATSPVVPHMIEGRAIVRYSRVSPQKARLVIDLIRGQGAEYALQTLRFTKKRVARDIEKILRSAIANAERKAEDSGAQLDVDHLYISECFVNEGSRWKRIRPAPRRPPRLRPAPYLRLREAGSLPLRRGVGLSNLALFSTG